MSRRSNSTHLEEDNYKHLSFDIHPFILERDPADFSQQMWRENSMWDRNITLRHAHVGVIVSAKKEYSRTNTEIPILYLQQSILCQVQRWM